MKSGLSIRAQNSLDTHLHRRRDFTGNRERMSPRISSGISDIGGLIRVGFWNWLKFLKN